MTGAQHVRNLLGLYDTCTAELKAEALVSYWRYHNILKALGARLGFEVEIACAVFSALSPNNDYVGNLRDARKLMEAVRDGRGIDSFKVSTYHSNKRKAWAVATGQVVPEMAFAKYIYWSWMGRRGAVKVRSDNPARALDAPPHLNNKLYEEIADCIRFVAEQREVVPNQAQAVIWQNYRARHNIQRAQQLELIASDLMAAHVLTLDG